jgi:hypothetical protein
LCSSAFGYEYNLQDSRKDFSDIAKACKKVKKLYFTVLIIIFNTLFCFSAIIFASLTRSTFRAMRFLSNTIFRNAILSLTALVLSQAAIAQTTTTEAEVIKTKKNIFSITNPYKKPSKDYVMLQIGFNSWTQAGTTNAKLSQRGHDVAAYICYDFPFSNSRFSFAIGAGLGSSNVYLKNQVLKLDTTYAVFRDIKADSIKRYKLSTNYLEFPIELRFFGNKDNRNTGFKASIGARLGTMINAHTKAFIQLPYGNVRDKASSRSFFETWRIMPMARIGYGNFSLYGAMQINELFRATNTTAIGNRPYSFGLTISGL